MSSKISHLTSINKIKPILEYFNFPIYIPKEHWIFNSFEENEAKRKGNENFDVVSFSIYFTHFVLYLFLPLTCIQRIG